jgi:hypothetical protein
MNIEEIKTGVEIIAEERTRQINDKGYTLERDTELKEGDLAKAAATFCLPRENRSMIWPWGGAWWKPTPDHRIKELAKAGALIAAEIDRIQRAKS